MRLGFTPGLEEPLEQGRAFFGQDTALNLWAPMAGGPLEKAGSVNDRAALGIVCPKNKPTDARMADGTRAHGAGLERHDQRQTRQPVVSDPFSRSAQGQDLSVGGGVIQADGLVPRG